MVSDTAEGRDRSILDMGVDALSNNNQVLHELVLQLNRILNRLAGPVVDQGMQAGEVHKSPDSFVDRFQQETKLYNTSLEELAEVCDQLDKLV